MDPVMVMDTVDHHALLQLDPNTLDRLMLKSAYTGLQQAYANAQAEHIRVDALLVQAQLDARQLTLQVRTSTSSRHRKWDWERKRELASTIFLFQWSFGPVHVYIGLFDFLLYISLHDLHDPPTTWFSSFLSSTPRNSRKSAPVCWPTSPSFRHFSPALNSPISSSQPRHPERRIRQPVLQAFQLPPFLPSLGAGAPATVYISEHSFVFIDTKLAACCELQIRHGMLEFPIHLYIGSKSKHAMQKEKAQ
ncbi:hypothetical protein BCR44DRAFT_97259 [Catenaria anguillulae PL171]|uniref:Uncharacterized protein n=1 Tax=Catenaria anguillulae PL171 TaxID=765915 RepID=A0A1Y2HDQ8_9FUNG|nr:hypothetical protein BCR44DRAFT_97259 [Catenaria anguillulae PL171]